MEDCTSCKVISTGALLASSAYLAYGAAFWTDKRVNKKLFLYPFSGGKHNVKLRFYICFLHSLVRCWCS